MIVEEMNILNTIFLRSDNQKIYIPNSVLLTRSIGNFYRSPDMSDTINFLIHVGTPADKIATIKQQILRYQIPFHLPFNSSSMFALTVRLSKSRHVLTFETLCFTFFE